MAQHEQDRENLLAEARQLVERASLSIEGCDELVVGFRATGDASFYFGASPVYQFNARGQLRRAFVEPLLYKAEQGRLVGLRRHRTAADSQLLRVEPSQQEQDRWLAAARAQLHRLQDALEAGAYSVHGQVPPDADVIARVRRWLAEFPGDVLLADSPRCG